MNSKRFFYLFLLFFTNFFQASLFCKDKVRITVFVHGTVASHLGMFNPGSVWKDALNDELRYVQMVKQVRNNPLLWQGRFMLNVGPSHISKKQINDFHEKKLSSKNKKLAAYQMVPAYDFFDNKYNPDNADKEYYLFGHLGLLSHTYRKQVSFALYDWLCIRMAQYQKEYDTVELDIVAMSHGGNISLCLAFQEEKFKRSLRIDNLILFGTPIHDVGRCAYHPIFKKVINCHSDGDRIQVLDRVSTKKNKSHRRLSDTKLSIPRVNKPVYDIRLLYNDDNKHIGHADMFVLDVPNPVIKSMQPLPIIVLTPLIKNILKDHEAPHLIDCDIIDESSNQLTRLDFREHHSWHLLVKSPNFYNDAMQISSKVTINWNPDSRSRIIGLNKNMFSLVFDAFRRIWKKEPPRIKAKL